MVRIGWVPDEHGVVGAGDTIHQGNSGLLWRPPLGVVGPSRRGEVDGVVLVRDARVDGPPPLDRDVVLSGGAVVFREGEVVPVRMVWLATGPRLRQPPPVVGVPCVPAWVVVVVVPLRTDGYVDPVPHPYAVVLVDPVGPRVVVVPHDPGPVLVVQGQGVRVGVRVDPEVVVHRGDREYSEGWVGGVRTLHGDPEGSGGSVSVERIQVEGVVDCRRVVGVDCPLPLPLLLRFSGDRGWVRGTLPVGVRPIRAEDPVPLPLLLRFSGDRGWVRGTLPVGVRPLPLPWPPLPHRRGDCTHPVGPCPQVESLVREGIGGRVVVVVVGYAFDPDVACSPRSD